MSSDPPIELSKNFGLLGASLTGAAFNMRLRFDDDGHFRSAAGEHGGVTATVAHRSKTPATVERGGSTEAAYKAIREMIVQGRLAPGTWIAESDLTHVLSMSRTPIHVALQWLHHEGYVLERGTRSKSRMMVAPLTLSDAYELYGIVGRIEGLAGRQTASLSPKKRTALVSNLKKLNSELSKTAKSSNPDPERFVDVDTTFHDRIVVAGAGARLLAIYYAIKPQTDRYWRLYSNMIISDLKASCLEHEGVIDAISRGDGERTEQALRVNWENGAERLGKAIMKFGELGAW